MGLETEVLKKLVKAYGGKEAVNIYDNFVYNYRKKHIGESNESWYNNRGIVFDRFVHRYYLKSMRHES